MSEIAANFPSVSVAMQNSKKTEADRAKERQLYVQQLELLPEKLMSEEDKFCWALKNAISST
jgi:hypothetical protein